MSPLATPARGRTIAVLTPDYRPSHGNCPACGRIMDESGCRVVTVGCVQAPAEPPLDLADHHRWFWALAVTSPFFADVACRDPLLDAAQRAWDQGHHARAHRIFMRYARQANGR